jgi:pimeloyl-ACP methyl ester carboxylesterase
VPAPGRRERVIRTNGIQLHVVEAGPLDGPLVILLHGFPEFWYAWDRQIDSLAAAGYHVVVPDQRGYNTSSRPRGVAEYHSNHLAADVVGLIDASSSPRATIVGHDWGGAVAWWTAARYPGRVQRIAILGAAHPRVMLRNVLLNPRQTATSWYVFMLQLPWIPEYLLSRNDFALLRQSIRWAGDEGPITPAEEQRYVEAWSQPHALTSMINWYRAGFRSFPLTVPEAPIEVPVLLIWGEHDQFLRRSLATESMAYCPNGQLAQVAGTTHWVHHEKPAVVAALLREFLESADSVPRVRL